MIVSRLEPSQISAFWDDVQPGVEEIFKLAGTSGWIPSDVFRTIKEARAALCFVYDDDSERIGWFVYRILIDAGLHLYCHLWMAWEDKKYRGSIKGLKKNCAFCLKWLKDELGKTGIKVIEMGSNRVGWMRIGPQIGLKPHHIAFRMEN